jgi:hypothetical protein
MPKKQRRPVTTGSSADPLGKLLKEYRPNAAGLRGVAILAFLGGVGVLVYCQFQTPYPFKLMLLGIFLLAMAPVLLIISGFHFGDSLQVRRYGMRLLERDIKTDVPWEEIADVEVNRTDVTNLGVATVWSKRSDLKRPGLLTARTEWEILIHRHDGRVVRLSRAFLQYVPDVRSLVILLRKNVGLK